MGHTDYLFKMPNLLDGAARSVDLFGDFDDYNYSETGEQADAGAIERDIRAVSDDIREAVARVSKEVGATVS